MPIDLPAMLTEQQEAWQAVFEIHSAMPHGWVLVGGQAVYLHAIERGAPFVRPTKDADMALDIRAYPTMLHDFTALLVKLDFESAGESHEGHQHRRKRGDAPASQQALDRAETVDVVAGAAAGRVNRPPCLAR